MSRPQDTDSAAASAPYAFPLNLRVAFVAWFTDAVVPLMPMRTFSRLMQFGVSKILVFVKFISWIWGKKLPPGFNTPFQSSVSGVRPEQVRWFAECPNRQRDDPVILYLHGGGYGWAMQPPQGFALRDLYTHIDNSRLSILILDYTTTVKSGYPTQLREAVAVYNSLAATTSKILLLGDSAGGHLSFSLMRHIQNSDPEISPVSQKPYAFAGISPAVDMYMDPSVTVHRLQKYDILSPHMMRGWGLMVSEDEQIRSGPKNRIRLDDSVNWDTALPPPSHTFISYGGREILSDSIGDFIEKHKLLVKGVTVYVHPLDFHDSLMMLGHRSPVFKPAVEFFKTIL